MQIPREQLCRAAGISSRTYRNGLAGVAPYPSTVAKLNRALDRFNTGFAKEAGDLAPHAAFKMALVVAAFYLDQGARTEAGLQRMRLALNSRPSQKANADPEWHRAAIVRRLAIWLANGFLGFRGADLGRAAGCTRQNVSEAVKAIEDGRENDPALNRICSEIERVFE